MFKFLRKIGGKGALKKCLPLGAYDPRTGTE